MYRLFYGIGLVILLQGCSSKKEQGLLDAYHSKMQYHKYLQKTEKADIFEEGRLKASLIATYLYRPNFKKQDSRDEVFIVGVHFEDPENSVLHFDKQKRRVSVDNYMLTLNSKNAVSITPLEVEDTRLKDIPFVTPWGIYYEVKYPYAGDRFKLIFENETKHTVSLSFSKLAKFVYTKKAL